MSVKISELPILDSPADNDVLAGVDTSANVTKKIELATLKNYIDTNTTYTAGTNIDITNNVVSAPNVYNKTETDELLGKKDEEILDLQEQIDELSTIYNAFPTASGEGESVSLDGTAETKFKKIDLKGNTSQTGTPTPDTPIPVNVVSGDNSVVVTGKNILQDTSTWGNFSLFQATYTKTNTSLTVTNTNANKYASVGSNIIKIKQGYTYTISMKATKETNNNPSYRLGKNDNSVPNIIGSANVIEESNYYYLTYTFTANEDFNLNVSFYPNNTTAQMATATFYDFQIEKSSNASNYEPYQSQTNLINLPEGMELCKIGDYQDYFYKDSRKQIIPNEYQQVEYIESSGTQYIDTGVIPNINIGFKIKATPLVDNNTDNVLIGSRFGNQRFYVDFDFGANQSIFYGYGTYGLASSLYTDNMYDISFNYNGNKQITVNGTTTTMTTTYDSTNAVSMYIFRANYTSPMIGSFRLYSCEIYNGTTLIRNFIPCYRKSDNEVGLYDLVTNTFFENKGTGTFNYGASIGAWYLHKEILKETMSTLSWIRLSNGSFYVNNFTTDYNCLSGYGLSNLWEYSSTTWTSGKFGIASSSALWVATGDSSLDTTTKFVTLLSNGNGILYGVLSTPTDTEVTYTPLIEQLNNLEKAMSYNGQTNISQVNNDLPFIINAEAIMSLQNVLDRIELLES